MDRVSVIIPAYNASGTLARAVESALSQTRPPDEIIVVDDGSADRTPEVARGFGDRLRYLRQENAGAAAARNRGVAEAAGDWVAFLDADDWWLPHRLQRGMEIAGRQASLQWVGGGYARLTGDQPQPVRVAGASYASLLKDGAYFEDYFQAALAGACFSTCSMLIRRSTLVEAGGFDPRLHVAEDVDLWMRLADRHPKIGYIDEPVFVYDLRGESLTRTSRSRAADYQAFFARHIPPGFVPAQGRMIWKRQLFGLYLSQMLRALLHQRDPTAARQFLRTYGDLLSKKERTMFRVLFGVPEPLLRLLLRLRSSTRNEP
jgi:glycosyltransferase involved in cell wall biosynthesis